MKTARVSLLLAVLMVLGFASGCGGKRPINRLDGDNNQVEMLGSRKVNFGADRDTIVATMLQGTFHAIRLDVDGDALEMWDVDVFFSNGGHQDVGTRLTFRDGSWSRRIDLTGGARGIKKVVFKYKSLHRGKGRATIKLYGIH